MNLIFLIIGIVLFLLAAVFDFGWFGAPGSHVLGLVALGLAVFAASFLPWSRWRTP